MPMRVENIEVRCPLCLMPHVYRLKIYYKYLPSEYVYRKNTEVVYVKKNLDCIGLNEQFETKLPIYFSKNERIERIEVKSANAGNTFIG